MNIKRFQSDILSWYDQNKRILPWRNNVTPYRVWISEIMLQQTKVETVRSYFKEFMSKFPSVKQLASAPEDVLMKTWEGLGYYSRARNLQKAAKIIVSEYNSEIPNNYKTLLSLPGIGPYTAGAILSIAFNQLYTAVDGNVYRVMSRLYAIEESIKDPQIKTHIKDLTESLLPVGRVNDFNQAMMEIGALICLPKNQVRCAICPLQFHCEAFKKGLQTTLPNKPKKPAKKIQDYTYIILNTNQKFAIRKRPNSGLLASLYEFPNTNEKLSIKEIQSRFHNLDILKIQKLPTKSHVFTHLKWNINAYLVDTTYENKDYMYISFDELQHKYSIPKAFNQYLDDIKKSTL
jgi:A/G-specific adenine glycosylase